MKCKFQCFTKVLMEDSYTDSLQYNLRLTSSYSGRVAVTETMWPQTLKCLFTL